MGSAYKDIFGYVIMDEAATHYAKVEAVSKLLMDKINGNQIYEITKDDVDELAAEIVHEILMMGSSDG